MIRRRRRPREIPFSFDSFLDVVANVVGIIIRLILVVWVGARSYSSIKALATPAPQAEPVAAASAPVDPLSLELARHRQELAQAQARLLEHLRQVQEVKDQQHHLAGQLALLSGQRLELEQKQADLQRTAANHVQAGQAAVLSLAELRQRQKRVLTDILAVEQQPPLKQLLHYQTPVSRPVHSEELLFECRQGRVAFIDVASLLADIRQGLDEKGKALRTQWSISDVTNPVGAFQLRYTLERERDLVDGVGSETAPPNANGNYRYGLSEWTVEPVTLNRGETEAAALAPGSEFRQVVDTVDPQQVVVTFWVYPDSFALFRRLRDYLYERDVIVAGRPLPEGQFIRCSRHGTVSRGQ